MYLEISFYQIMIVTVWEIMTRIEMFSLKAFTCKQELFQAITVSYPTHCLTKD